jgi:hypothetical protein
MSFRLRASFFRAMYPSRHTGVCAMEKTRGCREPNISGSTICECKPVGLLFARSGRYRPPEDAFHSE